MTFYHPRLQRQIPQYLSSILWGQIKKSLLLPKGIPRFSLYNQKYALQLAEDSFV